MASDYQKTENTDHSPLFTVTNFCEKLEQICYVLRLDRAAYLPGAEDPDELKEDDYASVLAFFGLGSVADTLGNPACEEIPKVVYIALQTFVRRVEFIQSDDLKGRWEKSIDDMGRRMKRPPSIDSVIEMAQRDSIIAEGLKRYNIASLPKNEIKSILGVLLLWIAALPYANDAQEERSKFRDLLQRKLHYMANPQEFRRAVSETLREAQLVEITKSSLPKSVDYSKEYAYSEVNESDLNNDKSLTK